MKQRIYLRIGKTERKYKVDATTRPSYESLTMGSSTYTKKYIPTVMIALDIDIPDNEFSAARILLETKIKESKPAVEIKQVNPAPQGY